MPKKDTVERYLLDGTQMNLIAFIAGTMGFLKEKKVDTKEWASYIGKSFEDSWQAFEGAGADEIMEHLIPLQIQPFGAEVISSKGDYNQAEVILSSLPSKAVLQRFGTTPREILGGFGITQREFAALYDIFKPSAAAAGFQFTHKPGKGSHIIELQRKPSKHKKQRPGA